MSTTLNYRIRVRNAADSADALVLTSVRGGTNPYLAEAPMGDGQEVDPLTGEVRTGSYTIQILDPITSGTTRVVTSQLFDANGRQQLLSRRCYIEVSTNGGSSWSGLIAGYLMDYRLADAITWEFTVGDTRRIEQTKIVFDGTSANFAKRGCIFGGPIVGGTWGPIPDRGGWKFTVSIVAALANGTHFVGYQFKNGYRGINDALNARFKDVLSEAAGSWDNWVNQAVQSDYNPNVAPYTMQGYPTLTARVAELTGGANAGLFTPAAIAGPGNNSTASVMVQAIDSSETAFGLLWPAAITLPTVGDVHSISCYGSVVSDRSPVYLDEHPVDIVTKLWTDAGIAYDATAASNLKTLIGPTLRVAMRITKSTTLLDFVEKSIFGPFGFSARTNSAGVLELFSTRLKLSATPSTTIGTNDLQDDGDVIFDNDEATIVSSLRYKTEVYWAYNPSVNAIQQHPLDSVYVAPNEVVVINADVSAFSTKEVVYELQGMIHDVSGLVADMPSFAAAVALEMFDRFGRGAPVSEMKVLRGSDTGFQIGDELYIEPAHLPNLNKRFGDDPSVGARIMQILRRTESPAGPLLKCMDAGSAQQPVVPAAVITIAASGGNPRSVAEFTITNAAAINATAVLVTAVQWATGGSAPSSGGPDFIRYNPGSVPTTAVQLPAVAPASKVWVRARTEQDGRRPSAWTAWTSVTLSDVATPSALSFSGTKARSTIYSWTPANATDLTDVYAFKGTVAPADWTPYFVGTSPAGTNTRLVGFLDQGAPTTPYIGAIQHRDPVTGKLGPMITNTFSTNLTFVTIATPTMSVRQPSNSTDSSLPSGIILDIVPEDESFILHIERSDIGGSGAGDWTEIARVRGSQRSYIDYLPSKGASKWYRAFAEYAGGSGSSNYNTLDGVLGVVSAIPQDVMPAIPVVGLNAKTQYGIIGGGASTDYVRAKLALADAELDNTFVDFGDATIPIVSPGISTGAGIKFDTVSFSGSPGFTAAAGAYAALTITGAPSYLVFNISGTGGTRPTVNLVNLSAVARVQVCKIRAYNADGYGVKIDASYDWEGKISVENCGNATYPAFSMNDSGGQVCNATHITQLQVEGANKKAIDISSNCINCCIDNIHSEGAIPDVSYPTWILGGGSCTYNNGRFACASGAANSQLWLRGAYTTYDTLRAESVPVVLEGTSGTSITIIEPNFTAGVSEYSGQSGKLIIVGGNKATITSNWTGPTARRFFVPDSETSTWTPGVTFGGNATGMTFSARTGTYSRVGQLVNVTFDLTLSAKGSSTGAALITGLPFSVGETAGAVVAFYGAVSGFNGLMVVARADAGSTTIALALVNSDTAPTQLTDANFTNTTRLIMSITYRMA